MLLELVKDLHRGTLIYLKTSRLFEGNLLSQSNPGLYVSLNKFFFCDVIGDSQPNGWNL